MALTDFNVRLVETKEGMALGFVLGLYKDKKYKTWKYIPEKSREKLAKKLGLRLLSEIKSKIYHER